MNFVDLEVLVFAVGDAGLDVAREGREGCLGLLCGVMWVEATKVVRMVVVLRKPICVIIAVPA